jgi:hypothetical protein
MTEDSRQSRRCTLRCLGGILAAAVAVLTAACSGSSPGGSADAPPAASGSASPGGSSAAVRPISQQKQLAYSNCMRSHGVPGVPTSFPSLAPGKPPKKANFKPAGASGPAPGSPQWEAAQQACRSLMPAPVEVPGGAPTHS